MKILNTILKYSSILLLLVSCTKELAEEPKTFISPDQFFINQAQCIEAVNGVYGSLYSIYGQEDLWLVTEAGHDLSIMKDPTYTWRNYTFDASNCNNVLGMWNKLYTGIKNANLVINRIPKAPITDVMKSRLLGEAKFLRASYYFMLSNLFGDVPLWTNELDVDAESILPRSPVSDVRKQIIKDLQDAIAGLPLSYPSSDVGRATKGAAQALLAKVYLYSKDWINAQNSAQDVVNGGQYSLLPNYAQLFDLNCNFKNNKESIFEIQFKRDAATNLNLQVTYYSSWYMPGQNAGKPTFAGVNFGTTVLLGYNLFYPSKKLVNMFEANDVRKNIVLGYSYNGQLFTTFPNTGYPWFGPKFWDLSSNGRNSGKDVYYLRYADVILMLAEALNEQGKTDESILQINKIRARAGLTDLSAGLSQSSVRNIIMNERGIEFVGEFQRRFDLVRWGILVDAVKSIAVENPTAAANIKPFHTLFPIPSVEIAKNSNLTQNTGY